MDEIKDSADELDVVELSDEDAEDIAGGLSFGDVMQGVQQFGNTVQGLAENAKPVMQAVETGFDLFQKMNPKA